MQLVQMLRETTERYPNKAAYVFGRREYPYRELEARVNQMARCLANLGVGKGDCVGLMLPNIPDFPVAYFGALSVGAWVVPLNMMYRPREIAYIMNDCRAKVIIAAGACLPAVLQARSSMPTVEQVITKARGSVPRTLNLDALLSGLSYEPVDVDLDEESVALICYTAGTMGDPKGALLTHRNLLANLEQLLQTPRLDVSAEDVCFLGLPLFHIYGLNVGLNLSILKGMTAVLVERFEPELAARLIQDCRVSLLHGFPTNYVSLVNLPTIRDYDRSSLRIATSEAGQLPVRVLEAFRDLTGLDMMESYGMTETSPVLVSDLVGPISKAGSVGRALPGVEICLVDEDEQVVPVGERGEVICRGPNVMKAYFNLPDETAYAFRNGWFHTADLATVDEDGYFTIVGRKTDMIRVAGFNVFPREVEEVLCRHPKVKEAAVVGVADPYQGEMVTAVVSLRPWQTGTEAEIIEYCREQLAAFKVPQHVDFRDTLPRSPTGKLLRRQLREEMMESRHRGNCQEKLSPTKLLGLS